MRRVLLSTVVTLVLSAAPVSADRYDDAYAQAQAKLATPEGQAYAAAVAARFDEKKLRDALLECAENVPAEDAPPFTVLMEMTADGRPTQVLLRPPAPVAVCLRWIVRESSFPRPPAPGYWVSVDLSATRAAGAPVIPTPGVATATVPPTRTPAAPRPAPAVPIAVVPTPTALPTAASESIIDFAVGAAGIHVDKRRPDLAALRRTLKETQARFLGPILAQSDGVAPDDPRLEAFWSLAEELDIPAVIPLGQEPVGDDAAFRVALGDPLKLESVLRRHPKLRIVVSGAAWPFGDAMVGLMWRYPQVFVDTGVIAWSLPRAEFAAYLSRLMDANLGDRILFASGGSNAKRVTEAADRIRSSDFLTPTQKTAIFSGNASRLQREKSLP